MISSTGMRRAVAPWLLVLGGMDLGGLPGTGGRPRAYADDSAAVGSYDPAAIAENAVSETHELTVNDAARNRNIALRVVLPSPRPAAPAPLILFSHGLGGSRQTSKYLGQHWAARGYAVVYPQHCGSDEAVWQNVPPEQRPAALAQAASAENARHRIADIHVVLDQLEQWTQAEEHTLAGQLDLSSVGMSGHSFGALTAQALGGQLPAAATAAGHGHCDSRIRATLAMSPSPPPGNLEAAFGAVKIPWLMMTGSKDHAPLGYMTPTIRRDVFNHLPPTIDRYELTLGGGHHFAFTDNKLPATAPPRHANHHPTILRVSTAFWDAHLRQDPSAKQWLQGQRVRATLDPGDRWRLGIAADGPHPTPSQVAQNRTQRPAASVP